MSSAPCNTCNWHSQPVEYGFTECFCDLLTPYQVEDKEKPEEKKVQKIVETETVKTVKTIENDLIKRTGC